MTAPRTILHVDMDAFFASVEQRDHPELRGKPVLVGHDGPRGVVAAASYEARRFGCRSAMPMAVAKRLCPQARIVSGRHGRYREASRDVFTIFERFTPDIEPLSIDEAFLDVTGVQRLHGTGEHIAQTIRATVRQETQLTCSVGVAPNKFLAKLASDMNKPDGLTIIAADQIDTVLPPLPVGRMWGVGPRTAEQLANVGVKTVGDLRRMGYDFLAGRFGRETADHFWALAHGRDDRAVCRDEGAKSISHEETFETDLGDPDAVREVLFRQVEAVAERVRRHGVLARRVALKIRFGDFQTVSRSRTLPEATDVTAELWTAAAALFDTWRRESFRPVRLIGMGAEGLGGAADQMALFADPQHEKLSKVDHAVDLINSRFGKRAVKRGGPGGT